VGIAADDVTGKKVFFSEEKQQKTLALINQATRKG
jgi:hypothetical protein